MSAILIVAPHPDDEVLGCGGVMKKLSNCGKDVYVLVVTRGNPTRFRPEGVELVRTEARTAHILLGVKETFFLEFLAPNLDTASLADISGAISNVITHYKIDELYLPHRGDIHHDHRAVFNAGLVAARPVNGCTVKSVYCYETLSETEWAAPFGDDAFVPTHFVNVSSTFDSKIEAMACFKTQLKNFPASRSLETIEALAKFRGATVGFQRAEAFMVIRTIED